MGESKSSSSGGIGLCGALFVLFLGLRLTEHVDWAWYWVAAPLWMPLGVVILCIPFVLMWMRKAEKSERDARASSRYFR